jgi:hypothetical protein
VSTESDTSIASERVTRSARVAQAVERCTKSKVRGDVVTRAELEGWFSLEFPSVATRRDYQRTELLFAALKSDFDRELLTSHRMALESERGGRWRIVLPSEHAELAVKTAREMFSRGLLKAQSIASNVDVAQLSDPERVRLDDTSARLASIQMFARKAMARELPSGKGRK